MKVPVSVVVPTKNEERNIESCLKHLQWADEIVILDSFSTDRTLEISQSFGAQIVQRVFDNFSDHKNWALENIHTRHNWIMFVDADEQVTPELANEISECINSKALPVGYYIARRNHFSGRWIRHGGWYPNWNLRLFQKNKGRYEKRLVHEHVLVDGSVGFLKNAMVHDDYKGIERWFDRHNHYSTLEAVEAYKEMTGRANSGRLAGTFFKSGPFRRRLLKNLAYRYLPARSLFKFFWMYFFRLGFLDGRIGFRYCLLQSFYEYQISLKLIELRDPNSPLQKRYSYYFNDE